MPHKSIIKESTASSRVRMMFDASCKPTAVV